MQQARSQRHTDRHRQPQCQPINTLHTHNCAVISEAKAQQSNPSVCDRRPHSPNSLGTQAFISCSQKSAFLSSHSSSLPITRHTASLRTWWRWWARSNMGVLLTPALGCPQATDLPNEGSTVKTSSRMNNREEQTHLAQHITYQANWMGGAPVWCKLPM